MKSKEEDDVDYEQPEGKEAKTPKVELGWSNPRAYIKSLCEIMDWRKLSVRDAYHILLHMFVRGGGDANDPHISLSNVQNIVEECRNEAVVKIRSQDFPDRLCLHFDEVKTKLDKQHGDRKSEHFSVTVTGVGGEKKLGIFEIPRGTGKRKNGVKPIIEIFKSQ